MGFNKRYIDKDKILNAIKLNNISKLTDNVDAVIMDSWASRFYENYEFNNTYKIDRDKLNDDVRFFSDHSKTYSHENFNKLKKLSNILENLIMDESWVDILLTLNMLGTEGVDEKNIGRYPLLRKLCIGKIINHYTIESRNKIIDNILK